MVALSGAKLQSDTGKAADIVYEGLRPGEKMFEELFITDNKSTSIPKVFSASESWLSTGELTIKLEELSRLVAENSDTDIRVILLEQAFTGTNESDQEYSVEQSSLGHRSDESRNSAVLNENIPLDA